MSLCTSSAMNNELWCDECPTNKCTLCSWRKHSKCFVINGLSRGLRRVDQTVRRFVTCFDDQCKRIARIYRFWWMSCRLDLVAQSNAGHESKVLLQTLIKRFSSKTRNKRPKNILEFRINICSDVMTKWLVIWISLLYYRLRWFGS